MTSGSLLSRSKSSVANNYPDPRVNRGLRPGLRVDPTNFQSPNGSNRVDHFSRPNPRVDPGFRNWVPALGEIVWNGPWIVFALQRHHLRHVFQSKVVYKQ